MSTRVTKTLVAAAMCMVLSFAGQAQEAHSTVINSAGGQFTNDKMVIEWSVGELVRIDTRLSENKNIILTQGLLQPELGRQIVLITEPGFAPGEVKILPNPVRSLLQVQFSAREAGFMRCMLYDAKGVRQGEASFHYYGYGHTQTFDMTRLSGGNYFLFVELEPVSGPTKKKGSYKIVKLN